MLPRFQRLSCDSTGSPSLSGSFTCLRPPCIEEDLLSSLETDHRSALDDRTTTCPPSPAPLIFVSVPLPPLPPPAAHALHAAAGAAATEVAGLVRSPACTDAPADICCREERGRERHARRRASAERYGDVSGSAAFFDGFSSEEEADGDSCCFECTTVSADSETASSTARAEEWAVVWMHVFPRHIASYLVVRDVVQVALVCRAAQAAVQQPWVWRSLAVAHYAVHPRNIERVFRRAAQQWGGEGACTCAQAGDVLCHHAAASRLRVCDTMPSLTRSAASPAESVVQHAPRYVGEVRALTASTSTTPWLLRQGSDVSNGDDAVEFGDEEEVEVASTVSGEDGDEGPVAFSTTQPQHETLSTAIAAVAAASAADVGREEEIRECAVLNTASAAAAAAPGRAATRAALAAGSRYLWQTAAAAMPSPSSPIATPHPEDMDHEEEERNAAGVAATTAVSPTPTAAVGCVADTVCCAASFHENNSPRPAVRSGAAADAPAAAACRDDAHLHQHEQLSSLHVKGRVVPERLPPPSPAQLDCGVDGALLHDRSGDTDDNTDTRGEAEDAPARSVSASSPLFRVQSSFAIGVATDVAVLSCSGSGVVVVPTATATAAGAAAAHQRTRSEPGWCVRDSVCASPVPVPSYSFTLCRATAERCLLRPAPEFPWQHFTRYLHANRVQNSLARLAALTERARAELCRGAWEAAYGSLSHVIHALCQQGSCRGVEHLAHLAQALIRRASLCRHRGHVHVLAAFTDLCAAALLSPHSVDVVDLAELCGREELAGQTPEQWLQSYEAAARVASPVALLGAVAQVPLLFPHHRTLCFCAALSAYMRAYRMLGQSITHLLVRAAEAAAPGTEEELLVRALRETIKAKQTQQRSHARRACATADYALSLLPLPMRTAVDSLCAAWVRDCFDSVGNATCGPAMLRWAHDAPEAVAFVARTPLDVRWLAWLTCDVQALVYKELTDTVPPRSALMLVVLSPTRHESADGLVRIAAQYASDEVRVEDLWPALPRGVSRQAATVHLLHSALGLRPLHPTAALLLSRVYAASEEGVGLASAVLTDCIHRWARRFELLRLDTSVAAAAGASTGAESYLPRRDRCPEACFVPAELLVGRNRCLHLVADLAEATEQHPSLSYPYQMRAAMAMDRGYCLAAVLEMGRIVALSLDVGDVALRVRFLQDAADLQTQATLAQNTDEATAVGGPQLAPLESGGPAAQIDTQPFSAVAATTPTSQHLLLPIYRTWLTRMSGLLALLHPPEISPLAEDEEEGDDGGGLATPLHAAQSCNRFFSRELPSVASLGWGGGHVSRVASLAVSEVDGDAALFPGGAAASATGGVGHGAADAAHIRAFLEDLVRTTTSPAAAPALS